MSCRVVRMDEPSWPAMYAHGGTGVPRTRLRMRRSRATVIRMAMFV